MAEPVPIPGGGAFAMEGGRAVPAARGPLPPAAPRIAAPAPPLPQAPRRRTGFAALHLSLGGVALAVPAALAQHIHPFAAPSPLPAAPPGILGLALLDGAPLPVLALPGVAGTADAALLVELRHAGRRFALPAARVSAGPSGGAGFLAWLDSGEAAALLALAPRARPESVPAPVPRRALVVFTAGGVEAALPADSVLAALPPLHPLPVPGGVVAAHRGAVLPVRDAGPMLGGPPTPLPAPLLRLGAHGGALLLVSAIAGLREVALADIHPLPGHGILAGLARLGGAAVPLLSPAALARGA